MTCPYLEYRTSSGDGPTFDAERPYCTAADRFVQAMRADVCNDRYELAHDRDCEIYRAHGHPSDDSSGSGATSGERDERDECSGSHETAERNESTASEGDD